MALNVVSNHAANVAHRNLTNTDAAASASLSKLSVGKRVVSARDDAASMAIGSRMNSELQGLKQAVTNAGQANLMLQIADGAMSTVSDILTRMKTLAIQASSGNLSDTEREFLDVEFQNLLNEVDRIADDTDFNGTKLLDGAFDVSQAGSYVVGSGVASITGQGLGSLSTAGVSASVDYATTGEFTVAGAFGTYSGSVSTDAYSGTGTSASLSRATTITLDAANTSSNGSITIALNTAFDMGTDHASAAMSFGGATQLDLSFKLGTGTQTEDSLSFTLDAVNTSALGLTSQSIATAGQAESAIESVNNAIDVLNEYRADVGAAQNRLDFAASNLRVSIENAEAARSTLLDLDIAQEMTNFTSKQVLMQSGVAMLAQANQMPQNLLRLLQ